MGLDSWFWLDPAPHAVTIHETDGGIDYAITATPMLADWDFGDGGRSSVFGDSGFGRPYPQPSSVTHVFEAHNQGGYTVRSTVRYSLTWTALIAGKSVGPYPMANFTQVSIPLRYPVEQAQPVLVRI